MWLFRPAGASRWTWQPLMNPPDINEPQSSRLRPTLTEWGQPTLSQWGQMELTQPAAVAAVRLEVSV